MKKSRLIAFGALCLAGGAVIAQTLPIPYVTSLGTTDIQQVIKAGVPSAQSTYASLLQMRSYMFGLNSQRTGATAPALTSCGGGTPAITGNDFAGTVTLGTSATGCVITFNTAYVSTPVCVATSQVAPGTSTPAYSVSATALTLVQASQSGNKWDYVCIAQSGG